MLLTGMPIMQAQESGKGHELSVAFQGLGIGSMPFTGSATWNDQPGLSLGFNVGYTYWFGEHFGFRTGVRLSRFSHNQKISNFDLPITTSLPMSSLGLPGGSAVTAVVLRGTATSIQEEQSYTFLELPIQLAMRFGGVFVNVGLSLSKAVNASADYSFTDPALAVTAIPDLGITPTTPVPMTLNGTTEKSVKNADMTKPFYCLLDAEVGYNFPLGDVTSLALGLYGRYAPIAYKTDNNVDIYALSPDATYTVTQPSTATQVEKIGYYEIGVSLGVNFGWNGKKRGGDGGAFTMAPANDENVDRVAAELAAMKTAREKTEAELAAMKTARDKAEAELTAMKNSRDKAEAELTAMKDSRKKAEADLTAMKDSRENDLPAYHNTIVEQKAQKAEPKKETPAPVVEQKATAAESTEAPIRFYFNHRKTQPLRNEEAEASLRELCDAMKNDANIHVVVTGYADNTGTRKNNLKIGHKRAYAVKRMMTKMGAPARNITVTSKGESYPVESNATQEGRANNRRATVEIK